MSTARGKSVNHIPSDQIIPNKTEQSCAFSSRERVQELIKMWVQIQRKTLKISYDDPVSIFQVSANAHHWS